MQVEEFLTISDEDIVYQAPDNDQIITELVDMFKIEADEEDANKEVDPDEMDDSSEVPLVSITTAINSLETISTFLLQQDDTGEYIKLLGKIESFVKEKQIKLMRQTTIDEYFM